MKSISFNFFPWVIYNKEGDAIGIKDDAPEEAKKAYADFQEGAEDDGTLVI